MSTAAEVGASINKLYANGGIARIASAGEQASEHLPTGIFSLDVALHGGWPRGAAHMVFGWQQTGKTLLAMRAIAQAQRWLPSQTACLVDQENTYDNAWGASQGIDNDRLLLVRCPTGEMAVDSVDGLLRATDTSIVVLDSLPALLPAKEQEKSAEDAVVAMQAVLINRMMRKVTQAMVEARLEGRRPTFLAINQWRNRIAAMGDNRVLPGGNAPLFFTSCQIETQKPKEVMGKDSQGREIVDFNDHAFVVKKNKVGNGIKSGDFRLIRNPANELCAGFVDDGRAVLKFAASYGLFGGGAGKYRIEGVPDTFRTHDDAVAWLYTNVAEADQLRVDLISRYRQSCGLLPSGWLPTAGDLA